MGFMDIFKRKNKLQPLPPPSQNNEYIKNKNDIRTIENPVEQKEENQTEKEEVSVKVFSTKVGENMEYSFKLASDSGESIVPVGKIYGTEENQGRLPLKEIAKEIEDVMVGALSEAKSSYQLNKRKEEAIKKLQNISSKNAGFGVSEDAIEYIEKYELEHTVDYKTLGNLPKKVDITKMSVSQLLELDRQLQSRLDTLDQIKTPDDAYADREELIHYMKDTEQNFPQNSIIEANFQSIKEGQKLDEDTTIFIAKGMENLDNEDGALYSAYLKLEEKRIWVKIKKSLAQYLNETSDENAREQTVELSEIISQLDSFELPDTHDEYESNILGYIIEELKQNNIERYIKQYKSLDQMLATSVNSFDGIDGKKDIVTFLYSRMGSLGQLSYKVNSTMNNEVLRNFIANTDFKDEDNKESKEFLLLVAEIEKTYIEKQRTSLMEDYKKAYKEGQDPKKAFRDRIAQQAAREDDLGVNSINVTNTTTQIKSERQNDEGIGSL